MKHTLLSAAIVVTTVLTIGWQPTEYPPPLDLAGKEVVVRVYNVPDPRGPGYVTTKGIIEGRTINFDFKDANDATTFVVAARDQNDRALTEFFGERYHKWAYSEGPPYYLPIS
ncbi:MAG: hypothetical protein ACYTBJ_15990, partial [Planctomycetota bacterium]